MNVTDDHYKIFIINYMFFCKFTSAHAQTVQRKESDLKIDKFFFDEKL